VTSENLARTPLYAEHQRAGARLVPFAGYEMPLQYEGIVAEHHAVRTRAGLFDVSHMGRLSFRGDDALAVVNRLITNDLARAADGQAVYTCCCNARGTILDDLIVYRKSPEDVRVVCNASNRDKIVEHFARETAERCNFSDQTDATALLALQGPRAFDVLDAASTEPAALATTFGSFRWGSARVAGIACSVARTGYTGEDGVELFCDAEDAAPLWRALVESGANFGLRPVGLGARDTLRLEARLMLYGNDIDETTHPLEAGLGWTVKLDKPNFIGKEALAAEKERGLSRRLVGFEMRGRGIARHGYPLFDTSGNALGHCTSGAPSPTLGKNIGLGYVSSERAALGTDIVVDCRGKSIPAVVVKTPFYKRREPG
jgi:aminomethyltransferase